MKEFENLKHKNSEGKEADRQWVQAIDYMLKPYSFDKGLS